VVPRFDPQEKTLFSGLVGHSSISAR
jgi:hypothetical protein